MVRVLYVYVHVCSVCIVRVCVCVVCILFVCMCVFVCCVCYELLHWVCGDAMDGNMHIQVHIN